MLRHEFLNGTNPGSVATSIKKLLTVFTAPTQPGHIGVKLDMKQCQSRVYILFVNKAELG